MVSRRFLAVVSIITTAAAFFLLGVFHARTDDAAVGRPTTRSSMRSAPKCARSSVSCGHPKWCPRRRWATQRTAERRRADRRAGADDRRHQARAAERDGPAAACAAARPPLQLRRALLDRQLRQDQLRHRRLSGRRLLRHGQARGGRAQGRRPTELAQDRRHQDPARGQGDSGEAHRRRRRRRRGAQRRLGDHQDPAARPPRAAVRTPTSPTISPSRSSGSATTTPRASSCRPATSGSGRPTAWSRA